MSVWVFGYGSLIWNPEFEPAERVIARATGYRRGFCMRSIHHRGTPEAPGLVLALDHAPGAICDGVAFRLPADQEDDVLAALRARELISSAYIEEVLPLDLVDGRQVQAISYVVDQDHVQYCGQLSIAEQADIIAAAVGGRGPNHEYLTQTAQQLRTLEIADPEIDDLAQRVRRILA